MEDLAELQAGEAPACPTTEPTWPSELGLAAAVAADVVGPRSHAAITAREHGIPAGPWTERGCASLPEDLRVVVGGSADTAKPAACPPW